MQHKLLAIDLDGTLIGHDGRIDPRDTAAIARARDAGVQVTIITGRLYGGTRSAAVETGITGPVACADGAHVVSVSDDQDIIYQSLGVEITATLSDILSDHHDALVTASFGRRGVALDARGSWTRDYIAAWTPDLVEVEDVKHHPFFRDGDMLACLAMGEREAVAAARADIESALGDTLGIFSFEITRVLKDVFAILIRAGGVDKGKALTWMAERHGCGVEACVAVGDWFNDGPMFDVAGRAFAMNQAPDALKARATDVLEANSETGGGVAEVIERVWGIS